MFEYGAWAAHPYLRSPSRSLLPESVRRELADLNGQYLTTIVATEDASTPLCWRGRAMPALGEARLLETMASCPFTLFELRLDALAAPATPTNDDLAPSLAVRHLHREALAHSALTLAWRLAESSPFSLRVALGLSAAAELVMNEMRVKSLSAWARTPGLMRTRWLEHAVFWKALGRAAEVGDSGQLARVHCLGITLLAGELSPRVRDGAAPARGASPCRR